MQKKNIMSTYNEGKVITDIFRKGERTAIYFAGHVKNIISEFSLNDKELEDKFKALVVDSMILTDIIPKSLLTCMDGENAEENRDIALESANHDLSFINHINLALKAAGHKLNPELPELPTNTSNSEETFFLLGDVVLQPFSIPEVSPNVVLAYAYQRYAADPRNEHSYSTVNWAVFPDMEYYGSFFQNIFQAALLCDKCGIFCYDEHNGRTWEHLEDSEYSLNNMDVVFRESEDEPMDKPNTIYVSDHPEIECMYTIHCPTCHKPMKCV